MPKHIKRKTKFNGVYYTLIAGENGRPERVYYICYRKAGKLVEELAGDQFQDNMTAEGAAHLRMERMNRDASDHPESREGLREPQEAWTFDRLWETYKTHRPGLKGLRTDENRYQNHLKRFGIGSKDGRSPTNRHGLSFPLLPVRRRKWQNCC